MTDCTVTRPVLRYHGGKWMLAPWIISHFPAHRVYVEPFAGAASVLLRKARSYAEVINDLDGEVVNVFRVLRDHDMAAELQHQLMLTPFSRVEYEESYLPAPCPIEQARRTIVRAFQGFGSASATHGGKVRTRPSTGFRASSNRSCTVPAHDWMHYPDVIMIFCARLQGVTIECRPAFEVIAHRDMPDTLIYCDPPYVSSARNAGDDYLHEMSDDDHRSLADILHASRAMVVISGYPSDLYNDLYHDWRQVQRTALADGARARTEVLWLNEAAAAGVQKSLF